MTDNNEQEYRTVEVELPPIHVSRSVATPEEFEAWAQEHGAEKAVGMLLMKQHKWVKYQAKQNKWLTLLFAGCVGWSVGFAVYDFLTLQIGFGIFQLGIAAFAGWCVKRELDKKPHIKQWHDEVHKALIQWMAASALSAQGEGRWTAEYSDDATGETTDWGDLNMEPKASTRATPEDFRN